MIVVREAVETDLPRFFQLDQLCFAPGIAYSLGEFRSLLASGRTIGLVAEEDGGFAGFVIAQKLRVGDTHVGSIVTIDVDAAFRRRGVGRLLMSATEKKLRDADARCLRLEVAVENVGAQNFYAGLGFQVTGLIRAYYGANLDALTMEKSLATPSTLIP